MAEKEVKKNSKFVKYITSYDDDIIANEEKELNEEKEIEDMLDNEYFNQTLCDIQKDLIQFVNEKSLPLCEYLTTNKINNFLLSEGL